MRTTTPPDDRFLQPPSRHARHRRPTRGAAIEARSPGEPYRQFLLLIAERIAATRRADLALAYARPDELLDDLRCSRRRSCAPVRRGRRTASCTTSSGRCRPSGSTSPISRSGSTAACIATRSPSSRAGTMAPGRLTRRPTRCVATLRTIALLQQRLGAHACHRYVVSFTAERRGHRRPCYALAERACAPDPAPELDVVPLFETIADLRNARATLDAMLDARAGAAADGGDRPRRRGDARATPTRRRRAAGHRNARAVRGPGRPRRVGGGAFGPAHALPRTRRCAGTRRWSGQPRRDGPGARIGGGALQGHRTGRGHLRSLRQPRPSPNGTSSR